MQIKENITDYRVKETLFINFGVLKHDNDKMIYRRSYRFYTKHNLSLTTALSNYSLLKDSQICSGVVVS